MCENKREEQLKATRRCLCPNPNITKPFMDRVLQLTPEEKEILSTREEENISRKSIKEMMLRNTALRYTEEELKDLRDKNLISAQTYYYSLGRIAATTPEDTLSYYFPPASGPIDIPKKETEAEDFWNVSCYPY